MSKLSTQEVEQIANLARLEINESEKKMYAEQLSVVFDFVRMLDEVDISNVEETNQVTNLEDVYREDEFVEIDKNLRKRLINSYPEKLGEYLKVKAVFSE